MPGARILTEAGVIGTPVLENWRRHFAEIDGYFRHGVDRILTVANSDVSRYGSRSAPAVYAALLATADFERFECNVGVKNLAKLTGTNTVTLIGALKILRSLRLIEDGSRAQRYVLLLSAAPRSKRSEFHPFELLLREICSDGRAAKLRGSPLLLLLIIGQLAKYSRGEIATTLKDLNQLARLTDHTTIAGLKKLQMLGIIKRWAGKGNRTKLQLVMPDSAAAEKTSFLRWLDSTLQEHRASKDKSKISANAWSCMVAVACIQGFDKLTASATHAEIQGILYGEGQLARTQVNKAVALRLIKPQLDASTKYANKTIILTRPPHPSSFAGADPQLILSAMLAWRNGLIRRLGVTGLRAQFCLLRESNYSQKPVIGSFRTMERRGIFIPDLRKLRDLQLIETRGSRESMHHILCIPSSVPVGRSRTGLLHLPQQLSVPTETSKDQMFCRMVASLICKRTASKGVWRRTDLLTFFFIAAKVSSSSLESSVMSHRELRKGGVTDPQKSLGRLISNGVLTRTPSKGTIAARYAGGASNCL